MSLSKSLGLSLALTAAFSTAAVALDLKVWAWPLTDQFHEPIDAASVRVDAFVRDEALPGAVWLEQVKAKNAALSADLTAHPIAAIEVTLLDMEDEIESPKPFVEEARRWAAREGANLVYLDKYLKKDNQLSGLRFIAYRAEYKQHLVSPDFLAALPYVTVPGSIVEEQLQAWEAAHFGKVHVSFGSGDDKTAAGQAVGVLAGVKSGTPVHVFLRDGSDLQGAFSGLDDDNRIWVHRKGWIGLFADRAVPTRDVQSVALLN
jgi:hypothetical protein